MNKFRFVMLMISAGMVAGCAVTPRSPAPVVERSPGAKPTEISRPAATPVPTPAPVAVKPAPIRPDSHGYYTVKKGDTLYRIALDIGQSYRDIIAWNNLANPNDIKVDQVLRVLPPETVPAASGAQTASVASSPAIEVRPLQSATPSPAVSGTPAPAASAVSSTSQIGGIPNKSAPRGDKRPYSDSAMAELQKPEASVQTVAMIAPSVRIEQPKPAEAKPAEKHPEAVAPTTSEEESVSWMWPADGKIIAHFDDGKKGIDIAGKPGQQILAAGSGKVMYAGSGIRGYGNLVIVKHTSNLLSAYAHNKNILVKEGDKVQKGQKIAEMGNTDADAVKLHFEIRQQGKPVDPSKFLPNRQ